MPVYTDNTPQGNQQIATTRPLIQGNFQYLKPAINQEHNFDVNDPAKTYHLQASMPNQALNPTLPSGTNGMYYVNGGTPRFKGATDQPIAVGTIAAMVPFNGSVFLNSGQMQNISPTITGNVAGLISVQRSVDGDFSSWVFISNNTATFGQDIKQIADTDSDHIDVLWNGPNLALLNDSSSTSYTFKYSGFYYPTV